MNSDVAKQRGWRWTLRRISRGGPTEAAWRVFHIATVTRWNRSEVPSRVDLGSVAHDAKRLTDTRPTDSALAAVREQAERIMAGTVSVLGVVRRDLQSPDWLSDADASNAMGKDLDGSHPNVSLKHVWELSRLAPVVDLCIAYNSTGDARYAERAVDLLQSWTLVLRDRSSVLWGSGVEAAVRIIAISNIIRLLSEEPAAAARLRTNPDLAWTVDRHLDRLARFPSRFSSANNHALVEAAGLVVGSVVFVPNGKATSWQALGLKRLRHQLDAQLDGAGLTKEKAADYHGFITAVLAMTVAAFDQANHERPNDLVSTLERMHGGALALAERGSPRFGDGDDSTVFGSDTRAPLDHALDLSSAVLGIEPIEADKQSMAALLLRAWSPRGKAGEYRRPIASPTDETLAKHSWIATLRSESALVTMRTGSIGYLAVAAHGHADLTSFQLTVDGRPVLVDPGTFCYDSHPAWRQYLRSSAAHNCLVLEAAVAGNSPEDRQPIDQAEYWGPFLWGTAPTARLTEYLPSQDAVGAVSTASSSTFTSATAVHDGYNPRGYDTTRQINLTDRSVTFTDTVRAIAQRDDTMAQPVSIRLTFAPDVIVGVVTTGGATTASIQVGARNMTLQVADGWTLTAVSGHSSGAGWVSPSFGTIVPTTTLILRGQMISERPASHTLRWS